ncbi:MAG TPA: ATP-binding protein [Kofleriaceae bacterium]|jgi:signal transduction histidine kinase
MANPITLHTPAPEEAPLQDKLNAALVLELLHRSRSASVALLLATLLMWTIVRSYTGGVVLALFVSLAGLTAIRMAGAIWIERRTAKRFDHMRAFRWFTAMNVLVGASLGAIILAAYPSLPPLRVAMSSVCIVGINSAALVSLAGSPLVYLVYVGANMAALTYVAFAHPLQGLEVPFQVMQIVYSAALLVMMLTVHRSLRQGIVLRLQLAASLGHLRDTQARLVDASRQAGRADVAIEVLHSVGNALNSVNVSAALAREIVAKSRVNNLPKVAEMVMQNRDDFGAFVRDDPRGQKLPEYLAQLAEVVVHDNREVTAELASLARNVDQIKLIVASQQDHVRPSDVLETFDVPGLLDDALRIAGYHEPGIEVTRSCDELPLARLDRHKLLQILIVLLANARDAVMMREPGERRIAVHARRGATGDLEIAVEDNGCGFDPGQLDRMFSLGFTTKPAGRGLGLHYSACAARELKGNLTARSAGVGTGASFLLALPFGATAA